MSSLARVINNSCSTTTLKCAKNIHLLGKTTSQIDITQPNHEGGAQVTRNLSRVNLLPRAYVKHPAQFCIHPEKLKQIIREKDGHIMCGFLSKEGMTKRKRCMMIMERKKRLMQTSSSNAYTIRYMSTSRQSDDSTRSVPSTSAKLHSKSRVETEDFGVLPTIKIRERKRSDRECRSADKEEIFIDLGGRENLSNRKISDEPKTSAKKKKKLRPIRTAKRTSYLSKDCEMNLPADLQSETDRMLYDLPLFDRITEPTSTLTKGKNVERTPVMGEMKTKKKVDADSPTRKGISPKKTSQDSYLIDNVFTLFDRVKLGSDKRKHVVPKESSVSTYHEDIAKIRTLPLDPTETYKIVNNSLKRKEMHLRKQFSQLAMSMDQLREKRDSKLGEKIRNICSAGHYLIRLPKTTPEGYRVLLYAVRDNDPTKMNFSDCVKGFCMYNDCVLSEDGLQEGYIVIFDMKGVQLGHLARVSLPALRCFMLYIQEAHPCRLKGIHILNTASWIHHVMRLVVPLVRSELLNLVQFHKGNAPDGFPMELLPADYGGEAPAVEELDNTTKSMVSKYEEWLKETTEWKADESKRVKKASWWGLFNGSNKTNNVELDEKTILKNLQID